MKNKGINHSSDYITLILSIQCLPEGLPSANTKKLPAILNCLCPASITLVMFINIKFITNQFTEGHIQIQNSILKTIKLETSLSGHLLQVAPKTKNMLDKFPKIYNKNLMTESQSINSKVILLFSKSISMIKMRLN